MREHIDVTGATEEEALRKGLEQLGMDRDEVSVEILERARRGFLGIGSAPAKVRISYGEEEEEPEPVPPVPVSVPEEPEAPRGRTERRPERPRKREREKVVPPAAPPEETAPAPAVPQGDGKDAVSAGPEKDPEKPEKVGDPKARRRGRDRSRRPQEPRPVRTEAPEPPAEPRPDAPAPVPPGTEVDDEKAQAIKAFLKGLLEHMGHEAEIRVYLTEGGRYRVILEGQGMGALIGRRGETLDAIQQLTSYAVNRTGNRARIQLDAEGYREKREQSLRHLARKTAAKVVKSRRSFTLEPMNAYERHVIHTALQDFSGVTTYSTGVDPNRRVIVAYDRENA